MKTVHDSFDFVVDFVNICYPWVYLRFWVFSVLGEFFHGRIFFSLFVFHLWKQAVLHLFDFVEHCSLVLLDVVFVEGIIFSSSVIPFNFVGLELESIPTYRFSQRSKLVGVDELTRIPLKTHSILGFFWGIAWIIFPFLRGGIIFFLNFFHPFIGPSIPSDSSWDVVGFFWWHIFKVIDFGCPGLSLESKLLLHFINKCYYNELSNRKININLCWTADWVGPSSSLKSYSPLDEVSTSRP